MTSTERLERARQVKAERAEILRPLREAVGSHEARVLAAALVEERPDALRTLSVRALLECCWGSGPGTARMLHRMAAVPGHLHVGRLDDEQAARLTALLRQPLARELTRAGGAS